MGKENYELLNRTDSICQPPDKQLLEHVRNNEVEKIKDLLENNKGLANYVHEHPYNKPILHIACCELADQVNPNTIIALINSGADLDYSDEAYNNQQAIHYAAMSGRPELLRCVIRKENINSLSNGNTALHLLIKEGDEPNDKESYLDCIKLLINEGIDVNKPDGKNQSAILLAARKSYKNIIKTILENSKIAVDTDTHKFRNKSAGDLITENNLYKNYLSTSTTQEKGDSEKLFTYLKMSDEQSFINAPNLDSYVDADDTEKTMLQWACQKGLGDAVACLLEKGADPNKTAKISQKPLEIAAEMGYYKIFETLLLNDKTTIPNTIEMQLLKHIDNKVVSDNRNYRKCYEIYQKCGRKLPNVNAVDNYGKSALHFAVRYGGSDATLGLLRRGASLASKNVYGELPIQEIDANTLQIHLDECLEVNVEEKIDEENFQATYNYETLMPPIKRSIDKLDNNHTQISHPDDVEADNKLLSNEIQETMSETEVIWYMSQSRELRHLLKHPVITSFLHLKWHRIRWIFYTNFAFFLLFCLSLILYIFVVYNNASNNISESLSNFLLSFLCVTFTILFIRELFQIVVLPKNYIFSFENMIELLLVLVTAWILFQKSPTDDVKKPLSAFAILFCAFVFILLIGHYPRMSTNIEMLRRVSFNFFKFFLWYSVLILAFAFSFYTLFEDSSSKNSNNNNKNSTDGKDDEEEEDMFIDPVISLFKTLIMLTGEFDAGSINFKLFPITSRLIFILFVIMIAIILLNLLNGLAVNDTQAIKSDAELVCYQALVEHIYSIENLLLSSILPTSILKRCQNLCCCLPRNVSNFKIIPQCLIRRICLFPHFLDSYKLTIYPNQNTKIILPKKSITTCCGRNEIIMLDKTTAKNTRNLIQEKKEKFRTEMALREERDEIIAAHQQDIAELKEQIRLMTDKLDLIFNRLS